MNAPRTSARPKLVEPSGFASTARANLAVEIAAKKAADDALTKLECAEAPLREAVYPARAAVGEAEQALKQAKAAASEHLLATAIGAAGAAPVTVKAARTALQDAEDALAAAVAARDGLAARVVEAVHHRDAAADQVKKAACAVIFESPAVAKVAADIVRLQRELVEAGNTVLWLWKAGAWPTVIEPGNKYGEPADEALRSALSNLYYPPTYWSDTVASSPGQRVWNEALAGLMVDANAPVPGAAP